MQMITNFYRMYFCKSLSHLIKFEPYQGKQESWSNLKLSVWELEVVSLLSDLPRNLSFKTYGDQYFYKISKASKNLWI